MDQEHSHLALVEHIQLLVPAHAQHVVLESTHFPQQMLALCAVQEHGETQHKFPRVKIYVLLEHGELQQEHLHSKQHAIMYALLVHGEQ